MANRNTYLRQQWLRWVAISDKYMKRMPLIPRNRWFNVYLHVYSGPDSRDEGLHDHPWHSLSIRLWGRRLWEYRPYEARSPNKWIMVELPRVVRRRASDLHAICGGTWPVVTLFITGPRFRDWGFATNDGWRPAQDVIATRFKPNASGGGYEHNADGEPGFDKSTWK